MDITTYLSPIDFLYFWAACAAISLGGQFNQSACDVANASTPRYLILGGLQALFMTAVAVVLQIALMYFGTSEEFAICTALFLVSCAVSMSFAALCPLPKIRQRARV